jgi:hypothetical protein
MNHVQKKYFILTFILIGFVFSCKKKDADQTGPKITFSSPVFNQSFHVNDYVHVQATVTDETNLSTISVSLLDDQLNPAHITVAVSVSSPSTNIDLYYALDNIHLETGTYYILITASDGSNVARVRQKIFVNGIPKVVKKIVVVSSSNSSQTNMSFVDSAFSSIIPYRIFSGDYIGSSVSSYYQQVYMSGNYTGNFTGIKLENNSVKFSVSPIVSSSPYFTGFFNTDKINYIARYDGFLRGYDYTGNPVYNASARSGFYVKHFCFNSNYLIAEEKEITSSSKNLITFYTTGTSLQQTPLNQDVVEFCEKDYANVFVFGNVAGQGVIQLFDRINNHLWSPYNYPLDTGSILSAVKIDANTYLIGHSNGTIYKYEFQNSSMTSYLTGYSAVKLKYDELNNELYVVEGNRISTFDYPTKMFHHSVNSSEQILDIHLLYNR